MLCKEFASHSNQVQPVQEGQPMIRATIRNGKIEPLGPLPSDWAEGRELEIQDAEESRESPEEIKKWWNDFNALCAKSDPEDDSRFETAIGEIRRIAKEQARREAGLS